MTSINQNIDQSELLKFEALANDWWKPDGKLKTLHVINPIRLKFINQSVTIKDKTILDVGCGGGLLCEAMAKLSDRVTGIDISSELIRVATDHAKLNSLNIDYKVTTIENLKLTSDKKYDVITCMEMLEHVPNPVSIIETMSSLLNPGGHLIFSTINRTLKSYLKIIIGAEYFLKLIPMNTHHYSQFIKPSELNSWLSASGIKLQYITGIDYIPVLDHAALVNDPSVNYMVHARLNS
ncbi:MAG: bifunctional 2-polyprenyl-6-hydroxyphenol methylase/3-demethylubiquinol 3-O-methyltransferase UbiG [Gammaproteobacteria bacterium]|jgi:2-polyprenyl-6-hydroxyphenyl methylase/3-demethylubiquinone-9 3-methyltransferase